MKLLNVNKLLCGLLSFTLLVNMTTPVFASTASSASTEYHDELSDSSAKTEIHMVSVSSFTALIPKTIVLDGQTGYGSYIVGARGNVSVKDVITIEPEDYDLTLYNVDDTSRTIDAVIAQDGTDIAASQIEDANGAHAILEGTIQAQNVKAGSWKSEVTFNILLNGNAGAGNGSNHEHNLVHVPAQAPTETTPGHIEYWYCDECGKYFGDPNGENELSESEVTIPTLNHVHSFVYYPAVDATTENEGHAEYWYCEGCDKYYSDANGENEVSLDDLVIPKVEKNVSHVAAAGATTEHPANIEYWYDEEEDKYYTDAALTQEVGKYDIYEGQSFTITSSNRAKIGYKDTANLVIPEMFYDTTDGVWYKVTAIDERAFAGIDALKTVVIGDLVTTIGANAFSSNITLTSVVIGNSATSVGAYAFAYNSNLTSIDLGNSVTTIGNCAFYMDTGLTSVVIPDSVTKIDTYAFSACKNLTLRVSSSVKTIGTNAFMNVPKVYYSGTASGSPWGAGSVVKG